MHKVFLSSTDMADIVKHSVNFCLQLSHGITILLNLDVPAD